MVSLLRKFLNGKCQIAATYEHILTFEERAEVLKNIMEINKMVKELNKENKLFLVPMAAAAGMVIIAVASAILAAMINNSDNDKHIFDMDDYN